MWIWAQWLAVTKSSLYVHSHCATASHQAQQWAGIARYCHTDAIIDVREDWSMWYMQCNITIYKREHNIEHTLLLLCRICHSCNHIVNMLLPFIIVLGKFGFKLIQTRFKPNQTGLKPLGLGISWMKLNGLVSGLGVLTLVQTISNHFKLIKESCTVWYVFSTLYEVLAETPYVYICYWL